MCGPRVDSPHGCCFQTTFTQLLKPLLICSRLGALTFLSFYNLHSISLVYFFRFSTPPHATRTSGSWARASRESHVQTTVNIYREYSRSLPTIQTSLAREYFTTRAPRMHMHIRRSAAEKRNAKRTPYLRVRFTYVCPVCYRFILSMAPPALQGSCRRGRSREAQVERLERCRQPAAGSAAHRTR